MTDTVTIHHQTTYSFERPVHLGPHTIRLHPTPATRARVLDYAMTVQPEPMTLHWIHDPLANRIARASFAAQTDRLMIDVRLTAELTQYNPFDFVLDAEAATWPFSYPTAIARELAPYASPPPIVPWLAKTFAALDLTAQSPVGLLIALNQHVRDLIGYVTRLEPGIQDPALTIERASGSCRDVAWLMVLATRALGFASRFTSGYLVQLVDPAAPIPGLVDDTADLHAWVEIYLPGAGWVGFDATSGLINGPGHIALASAAHPNSAAPVEGTTSAALSDLVTTMQVTRAAAPIPPSGR